MLADPVMKIAVVSGGFDPIHSGHLEMLEKARKFGTILIVLLNNDKWLENKKGKAFMPFEERKAVLESIKYVDQVIEIENDVIGSAKKGLELIKKLYPRDKIIFCNGGDRNISIIPEMEVTGVEFMTSVGGSNKKNSSSWILKNWQYDSEERLWGTFYNLFEADGVKVKELVVEAGKGMSYQKHDKRSEIWLVSQGKCDVFHNLNGTDDEKITLQKHQHLLIPVGSWHQITNPYKETCKIIEIQYGKACVEDDIFRRNYYEDIHTDKE